ncbi:HoxN/HupN/NixA family nickel/cobalt transporter [Kocuria rhizophila]|uniref:HoxN/HupN/NixA family nickel/cobalt transporter n=1 Tax=Kocuria rhizophila TaxID=72000 RepID=UPI001747E460|nr:nickel transporter [Kocuria rhizophila]MCG7425688.1 nickel transporter [Kocuria rhizophila]MCT1455904.1 nickel transporter [Kocuria rhizophila]MCT1879494.1 nickel transporter [Kocuria rhizophila]MCT2248968.1 nickel transporter [Kocuria rhizophila]
MSASHPTLYRRYVAERAHLPLRVRVGLTLSAVAALHLFAAGLLATALAPGSEPLALGVVLTAYAAGIKHSYDWDHISAIDNSTRKFVSEGMNPASVGFAFSLGHSLVVTLAGIMVVAGAQFVSGAFEEGSSANHVLGLIGAGVSGVYLLVLGLYNASISVGLLRTASRGGSTVRGHRHDLDGNWGLVSRLLRKPLQRVRRPRDIFVLGFLFGLGFDTATTIGLLLLTVTASLAGVPAAALIGLPVAFTAAMTLCDTLNGLGMMKLYSTALTETGTRMRFNATVTVISAVSALLIAVITLGGFLNDLLGLTDPVTTALAEIDLGDAGLVLIAVFALVWLWFWRATRGSTGVTTSGGPPLRLGSGRTGGPVRSDGQA